MVVLELVVISDEQDSYQYFAYFLQKDVMFRSAGANGTANGLYSPIANSDSSGFSEQRADLSSYR